MKSKTLVTVLSLVLSAHLLSACGKKTSAGGDLIEGTFTAGSSTCAGATADTSTTTKITFTETAITTASKTGDCTTTVSQSVAYPTETTVTSTTGGKITCDPEKCNKFLCDVELSAVATTYTYEVDGDTVKLTGDCGDGKSGTTTLTKVK